MEKIKGIKSEATYNYLIENNPAIILIIESDSGKVVAANKSAEKFYGYTQEEFMNLHISDINIYSKSDVLLEMELAQKEKRDFFKVKHRLKTGETKAVEVMSYPISIDKEYLLSTIREFDQYKLERVTLEDIFRKTDDAFILVNSEEIIEGEIVYCNSVFSSLIGRDFENVLKMSVTSLFLNFNFNDSEERFFSKNSQIMTLNNEEKSIVEVKCLKIRQSGIVYSVLQFKKVQYIASQVQWIDNNFDLKVKKNFTNQEGYLIGLQLFRLTNIEEIHEAYLSSLYDVLKINLNQQKINCVIEQTNGSILVFSIDSPEKISKALNYFVNTIEFKPELAQYNEIYKYRIGVSKKGKLDSKIIKSLNQSLGSFTEGVYNQVNFAGKLKAVKREVQIKNDLSKAIEEDQFILYGQPIVDVQNKNIMGVEILTRWKHKTLGLVYPKDFIRYAEITNQITALDMLIVNKSLTFISDNLSLVGDLKMHINLSSKSFKTDILLKLIEKFDIEMIKKNVVFEITEMDDSDILTDAFLKARDMGISFSIDDFGTGFSSFERIRQTGVDYIKIDRSFVKSLVDSPSDMIILKTILKMCNKLDIEVIAEGVETLEQVEFLSARKCRCLQGYYFLEAITLERLFEEYQQINREITYKTKQLSNGHLFSRKFYNQGRVFFQKMNLRLEFIEPNIDLLEKLGIGFSDKKEITLYEMVPERYWEYFKNGILMIESSSESVMMQIQLMDKNDIVYKVRCALKMDNDGMVLAYFEFLEDEAEESELLGLSKSYMEVFYKSPVAVILLNSDYQIIKCNYSSEKIIGLPASKLLGRNILSVYEPSAKSLGRLFNNARKEMNYKEVIVLEDNPKNLMITEWNVSIVDNRDGKRYICIVEDITQRVISEKEKNKIYKALDQSKTSIVMTDYEGNIEYVNETFIDLTGYSYEEAIQENTRILSSHEQESDYYNLLWKTIKSGDIWDGEFHNKKKNGDYYWCKASIYPIKEGSEITGFVGIEQDITQEKTLQSVNEQLKDKLFDQDKLASLGVLTSGILHEINNPLSYIQMNLSYLKGELETITCNDYEQLEEIGEAVEDITTGIHQIKKIADGLKKYVYKTNEESIEAVNVVNVIEETLTMTKNEYKYHADMSFLYDENEEILIYGYASKLKQVMMNLIINASHAIIAKDLDELGHIVISVSQNHDAVMICVEDDGIGMTDEVMENIFNPLFTTKKEGIGTGLGLSVSKRIIEEEHNGSIVCESNFGKGTKFEITIPIGT